MNESEIVLYDGKAICPLCNGGGTLEYVLVYIEVIYVNYKCGCGAKWRRVFHYIGNMGKIDPDHMKDTAALVKLIKDGSEKLKKKYEDSPEEFKT